MPHTKTTRNENDRTVIVQHFKGSSEHSTAAFVFYWPEMCENCAVCIMTSALTGRIYQVSDSGGRRGIREEALDLVGECLLVNGLCRRRKCICRALLVSIYTEVFMCHLGVCLHLFVWNLGNVAGSVLPNHPNCSWCATLQTVLVSWIWVLNYYLLCFFCAARDIITSISHQKQSHSGLTPAKHWHVSTVTENMSAFWHWSKKNTTKMLSCMPLC